MSAYADPIDYFFLKENNHYESECYYAIVKANSDTISNVKAGVTDDILDATVKVQPLKKLELLHLQSILIRLRCIVVSIMQILVKLMAVIL